MNSNSSVQEREEYLEGDERWLLAQRIAGSPLLSKSQRLSNLLLYLCQQTLRGNAHLLTEQKIAAQVFQRPSDFDPTVDTIVRSHMVRLRQKVSQYASEQSGKEPLRLLIPKGSYAVIFHRDLQGIAVEPDLDSAAEISPSNEPTAPNTGGKLLERVCIVLGMICAILTGLLIAALHRRPEMEGSQAHKHPLWNVLFQPGQKTLFVAADSSFVLLHRFTDSVTGENAPTIKQYIAHDYEARTKMLSPDAAAQALAIAEKRYTSFVDLTILHRLDLLPSVHPSDLTVRYARDIHVSDLKEGNLILSGARDANPWLELFEPEMNFYKEIDKQGHSSSFVNRHPQPGEEERYSTSAADPKQRVIGVLALLPNLSGTGKVLIIEGSSLPGTETISDFVFDDTALLPFLTKIQRPDGTLPYFEVLLESRDLDDNSGRFHILTYRVH